MKTIEKCAADPQALVVEARRHRPRQMHERELERVMSDSTTRGQRSGGLTIETGIDVPSANTILIESARQVRPGPSCTSCAAASAAVTTRPTPTC